jgi:hypothetical protein
MWKRPDGEDGFEGAVNPGLPRLAKPKRPSLLGFPAKTTTAAELWEG